MYCYIKIPMRLGGVSFSVGQRHEITGYDHMVYKGSKVSAVRVRIDRNGDVYSILLPMKNVEVY